MFTGIIESEALLLSTAKGNGSLVLWLKSTLAPTLQVDQSVAHDGICLTVEEILQDTYRVTAVAETIAKTNISTWQIGRQINVERSLQLGDRLDGHLVQGHVDGTMTCEAIEDLGDTHQLRFRFSKADAALVIEKGSVCINGVSLTCFNVCEEELEVAIIPYTWTHTNLCHLRQGELVNVEYDVLGKYMLRRQQLLEKMP